MSIERRQEAGSIPFPEALGVLRAAAEETRLRIAELSAQISALMLESAAFREVAPELAPTATDWVLTKWRYSAFHRSDLLARMRSAGRDQLVLSGVYAHVGVLATALDAFSHDIQPFLVADALGDFTAADHRRTLEYAAQCCAMVVLTEDVFS